ncbi:3'5'-cyclic nucleotide phosphodiesterase, partial [Opisthorchis viverrini]
TDGFTKSPGTWRFHPGGHSVSDVVSTNTLHPTRNLFTKVKNMDNVIKVIMEHAKVLVRAERVTLFLVDHKKNELYSSILDIGDVNSAVFVQDETNEIRLPLSQGIVGYVARTGQPIRIADAYKDPRFYAKVDEGTQRITKSVLAVPLADGKQVVGVIEMLNKHQGLFTQDDEEFLVAYSIYCTLAINVARMYDRIYRSDKKYRVALEVLTYHNCVTEADVAAVLPCNIPDNIPGITQIDKMTLIRFMLTVRKNYRPISYHNWDHAFSVAHSMYFLLKVSEHRFVPIEVSSKDKRFVLSDKFTQAKRIELPWQRDHNIFRYFRNASYRNLLGIIKHAILATDLATFWASKAKLDELLDSPSGLEWNDQAHRMSVVSIAMPTCDLCAMFKPWGVQVKVVMLIMQEFWNQGDREKASANKPLSLMDRDEAVQLADGQVGFIRAICLPCYSTIVRVFPQVSAIVDAAQSNLKQWEAISKLSYEERERILQQQMEQKFAKVVRRTAMNISSHARK